MPKPIVLTILDGWGYRPETHGNAIAQASKPIYDALLRDYPNTLLRAGIDRLTKAASWPAILRSTLARLVSCCHLHISGRHTYFMQAVGLQPLR